MSTEVKYLLIGGGVASVSAAQWIRERDATGTICIICGEAHPCYDRPPLSKNFLKKDDFVPDDAYSKLDTFYSDNLVELRTGVPAESIDRVSRTVTLRSGDTFKYEKLLLATGSHPKKLDVPGRDLTGVFTLRVIEDSEIIREAMKHSGKCAVIGAGYLGMEVASSAIHHGVDVTVIEMGDHPWFPYAGKGLGDFLKRYFEGKGAHFIFGDEVVEFTGSGTVSGLKTKKGQEVSCDFAVVGVGVDLNTDLAKGAGLELGDRGGVKADSFLRTSDESIWVAGDIALFEDVAMSRHWHLEHHLNARYQGRAAGAIMAGEMNPFDQVPYFFSDFLDLHMIQRGAGAAGGDVTLFGDYDSCAFVELYAENGIVRMGIAINRDEPKLDPISDKLDELIRAKTPVAQVTADMFVG